MRVSDCRVSERLRARRRVKVRERARESERERETERERERTLVKDTGMDTHHGGLLQLHVRRVLSPAQ